MLRRMFLTGLAAVLLVPAVRADPGARQNLRQALADFAKSVKAVVEKEGQTSVRIGVFSPLGLDDSNAGAGVSALLAEHLAGFADPKATLEVQGVYGFVPNPETPGGKVVKIKAKIFDTQTLE